MHATCKTAVDAQWHNVTRDMRRPTRPDVAKTRQQAWADQVEVSHHDRMIREMTRDASQLAAVEGLTMGQMNVGHAELAKVNDLANPIEQRPGRYWHDQGRLGRRFRSPHGQAVVTFWEGAPCVETAGPGGQMIYFLCRFLHEQKVRALPLNETRYLRH